jgi:SAM-dependent methyltransferase
MLFAQRRSRASVKRPADLEMTLDVHELSAFYASPLGEATRRLIGRVLRGRWDHCRGLSVMGFGFCGPYLDRFREEATRTVSLAPAALGAAVWPATGRAASALVVSDMLPLPDACIDRVLIAHALETAEPPSALLEEIWRVLAPEGRAILVAPSRRGVWARVDGTPFGHGQPFSRGQLRDLVRDASFSAVFWGEALYAPPFRNRVLVDWSPAIERVGAALGLPFAGVHIVEAIKQVYRPVGARRLARRPPLRIEHALAPTASREGL